MVDDRWIPPSPMRSPLSPLSGRYGREHLTDRERILSLEITDEHHEELHRQTAHRLEIGERRMDHIEARLGRLHQEQRDATLAREARENTRRAAKESRKEAMAMIAWLASLAMLGIAVANFATTRSIAPSPSSTAQVR